MCHIAAITHFKAVIAGHVIIVNLQKNMVLKEVKTFINGLRTKYKDGSPIEAIEESIKVQYPDSVFINELPNLYTALQI